MIDIIEHDQYIECIPHGKLTHQDYLQKLIPQLEQLATKHQQLNLLFFAVDFDGWEWQAALDDIKTALHHRHNVHKMALVTDKSLLKHVSKLFGLMIDGEIKTFDADQRDQAVAWLTS